MRVLREPDDCGTPEYYAAFRESLARAVRRYGRDRARHICGGFAVSLKGWHCMTCEGRIPDDEVRQPPVGSGATDLTTCTCQCLECGLAESDPRALNHYRCEWAGGRTRRIKQCRGCERRKKRR